MGHQQIKPVNTGIYMVRTLEFHPVKGPWKSHIRPAQYNAIDMDTDDPIEYWSFFGTDYTYKTDRVEIVVGPIL